jgi:phenylalanyl-tRNA synthetase alpha chain
LCFWEALLKEIEGLQALIAAADADFAAAGSPQALEEARVAHLGKKSPLQVALRAIGRLSAEERPHVGKAVQRAKVSIEAGLARARERQRTDGAALDITLPGFTPRVGRKHPLTLVTEEIVGIFGEMGFRVAEGPEVETDYYNFGALNVPEDHPARDLQDTFYLEPGVVLRTHTSPVQIRVMESTQPPVRVIAPGRCYREDTPDATHFPVFHQVEGLYVDRGVSFADLKGTIEAFTNRFFGGRTRVRFRPSYFPFVEPGAEYDLACLTCQGTGCLSCGGAGWLEISGAGMVHPKVLQAVGYDPEVWSGFAFGMGMDRITMIRFGINDIRLLWENDLRFIEQFS